ncbi:MAG TPA: phosphatidate cytidylyltransferase [Micropepsaceae bacterium]|nr:phosphatidate cytidylyltransferase [Micropepsaceae bacterium]
MTAPESGASGVAARFASLNLGVRTISALVLVGIAMVVVYYGEWVLAAWIALAGSRMLFEWYRMTVPGRWRAALVAGMIGLGVVLVLATLDYYWIAVAVVGVGASLAAIVAVLESRNAAWAVAGFVYVALPGVSLIWLREGSVLGAESLLWLLFTVWSTDVCAMLAGAWIGGPRLVPRLSPKKTWAGLVGALLASVICAIVFWLSVPGTQLVPIILAALVLSLIAQIGDLGESAAKRHFHVKDSGSVIPGHGGFLDRLDSLMAASLAYAAVKLFIPDAPFSFVVSPGFMVSP